MSENLNDFRKNTSIIRDGKLLSTRNPEMILVECDDPPQKEKNNNSSERTGESFKAIYTKRHSAEYNIFLKISHEKINHDKYNELYKNLGNIILNIDEKKYNEIDQSENSRTRLSKAWSTMTS